MPPRRRRAANSSAASLPADRLPSGTQEVLNPKTPTGESATIRSSSSQSHNDPHGDDIALRPRKSSGHLNAVPHSMNTSSSVDPEAAATAAAKLQRQRKRIDDMDNAVPLRQQSSSNKAKKGGVLDHWEATTQLPRPSSPIDTERQPATVRVNTFRTPLAGNGTEVRLPTASKPAAEDLDAGGPYDSVADDGFQVIKLRKGRSDALSSSDEPSAHLNRQTSLETAYDNREIYEVFGNALPGREFLDQNTGCKNGYVQFLQHPNGDVSAHQWSESRYQWVNLGQYSHSRRKIEGMLGTDRLKEETLTQAGYRHSLRYFRTVARQREAAEMGVPFGQKDIQMLLLVKGEDAGPSDSPIKKANQPPLELETPTKKVIPKAYTGSIQINSTPTPTRPPSHHGPSAAGAIDVSPEHVGYPHGYNSFGGPAQPISQSNTPFSFNPNANFKPNARLSQSPQAQAMPKSERSQFQYPGMSSMSPNLNRVAAGYGSPSSRLIGLPSYFHPGDLHGHEHLQWRHGAFPLNCPGPITQSPRSLMYQQCSPPGSVNQYSGGAAPVNTTPTSIHANSFAGNHSERLQNLEKITAAAKKRSLSQAHNLTAANEPFMSPKADAQPITTIQASALKAAGSGVLRAVTQPRSPPRVVEPQADSKISVHTDRPQGGVSIYSPSRSNLAKPTSSPTPSMPANPLEGSSPDTSWIKRPYEHSTPVGGDLIAIGRSGGLGGLHNSCKAQSALLRSAEDTNADLRAHDEQLRDWWMSSARLARQDDFFKSIKAADRAVAPSMGPHLSLNDKSTPSSSSNNTTWSETFTRLLIPVEENLAAYVQGPERQRRDYFTPWSTPPEWAIDRNPNGNASFYDDVQDWGRVPARIGRDPRYQPIPSIASSPLAFGTPRGRFRGFVDSPISSRYGGGGATSSFGPYRGGTRMRPGF